MAELRAQKEKLEQEIAELESSFEARASTIQRRVKGIVRPFSRIRRKPGKALFTAVLIGFVLGAAGSRRRSSKPAKKQTTSKKRRSSNSGSDSKFTSYLFDELKHVAAKKAMKYTSDLVEQKLASTQKSSETPR